ncbi:MAG: hypothetical protein ABI939_11475, partial [Anaerolineaceae bacterium]
MTEYALYLESGPQHKHTMVHVLDLLGCIVQGPTTDSALAVTSDGIREFLRFLNRHGGKVDPKAAFTTRVAQHVEKGRFIGQGNPPDGFPPDFEPLSPGELKQLVERLGWLRHDLTGVVRRFALDEMADKPPKGRALAAIMEHITDSSATYLRYAVGKVPGLPEATRAVRESGGDMAALEQYWAVDGACYASHPRAAPAAPSTAGFAAPAATANASRTRHARRVRAIVAVAPPAATVSAKATKIASPAPPIAGNARSVATKHARRASKIASAAPKTAANARVAATASARVLK